MYGKAALQLGCKEVRGEGREKEEKSRFSTSKPSR